MSTRSLCHRQARRGCQRRRRSAGWDGEGFRVGAFPAGISDDRSRLTVVSRLWPTERRSGSIDMCHGRDEDKSTAAPIDLFRDTLSVCGWSPRSVVGSMRGQPIVLQSALRKYIGTFLFDCQLPGLLIRAPLFAGVPTRRVAMLRA